MQSRLFQFINAFYFPQSGPQLQSEPHSPLQAQSGPQLHSLPSFKPFSTTSYISKRPPFLSYNIAAKISCLFVSSTFETATLFAQVQSVSSSGSIACCPPLSFTVFIISTNDILGSTDSIMASFF